MPLRPRRPPPAPPHSRRFVTTRVTTWPQLAPESIFIYIYARGAVIACACLYEIWFFLSTRILKQQQRQYATPAAAAAAAATEVDLLRRLGELFFVIFKINIRSKVTKELIQEVITESTTTRAHARTHAMSHKVTVTQFSFTILIWTPHCRSSFTAKRLSNHESHTQIRAGETCDDSRVELASLSV